MIQITSASNKKYKRFRSLMQKKFRGEYGEFTVEGIKSVQSALLSGAPVKALIMSDDCAETPDFGGEIYKMSAALFGRLSDTKTPQGIMAVIGIEKRADFVPDTGLAYVYCDGVRDPGNLGTIIRTADAAGFGGVILSADCADAYSPKTVRASMGSFFNIEIVTDRDVDDLKRFRAMGFSLLGGALTDDCVDYRSADYTRPTVIVIGNEANGISAEALSLCEHVKIPIYGGAESLNASVAAGVLMYEWARKNKPLI